MKKSSFVAIAIGVIYLIAAMAPIPYRFQIAPDDQVYDGTEFWSDDYSAYVSYIIQGQQGKWLAYDTHTSEPNLPGVLIHEEYVLWGKLTGVFGINAVYSYHLFRLVLGGVLLFLIWRLIALIFETSNLKLISFFLTLFVGGFPSVDPGGKINFTLFNLQYSLLPHIPWLTELDIFYRFVSLPHYLLGNIFFLLTLIQFIKIQNGKSIKVHKSTFVYLFLFGLGAGFTHAVSLVTLYLTFAIFIFVNLAIQFASQPAKSVFPRFIFNALLFGSFVLVTAPILFYFKQLLTLSPWSNLSAAWEATNQYYVPLKSVLLGIGPVAFLAPLGFIHLLKNKSFNQNNSLVLVSWPLTFFLLFYFSHPFLHISQVRFFQSYSFIGLSLLSAVALVAISKKISHFLKIKRLFLEVLLITLVFLPTYPLFQNSFVGRFTFFSDFNYLIYPPKDWAMGMEWLREHSNHDQAVLCAWQCGHHLPFMAGNYVYLGHLWGTLGLHEKLNLAQEFFAGKMTPEKAKEFFKKNNLTYVFWGYEERNYGGNPDHYQSVMTPIYSSPGVSIFQVN